MTRETSATPSQPPAMEDTIPARVTLTGTFELDCSPDTAIALFTPEGERRWEQGWDPTYHSGATDETGAVWTTSDREHVTWVTTDRAPTRVRYARVSSSGTAGLVEVACEPLAGKTLVRVTYDLTAYTPGVERRLQAFADSFPEMLRQWRVATAAALTTDERLSGTSERGSK